jgi:hypothetical protein
MTVEEAVVARLGASPGVTALVATRIYPMLMPQTAPLPAVTYQRISTERVQGLRGSLGLIDPRVQVDSWAETYGTAKRVAEQVRLALDGYTTPGGLFSMILAERDLLEEDGLRHRVSQDYSIWAPEP